MPRTTTQRALITATVAIPVFALLGMSAEAQTTRGKASAAREAAIARCIQQAQAADPMGGVTEGGQTRRVAVYKDCMTKAGFRP